MSGGVVVLSGASGLVGSALVAALERDGVTVRRLVRRPPTGPHESRWDPSAGKIDPSALDGVDAVINLAGENIGHRWTTSRFERIRGSRIAATETIVRAIEGVARPPRALLNASAVGIYGDRRGEILDESSTTGGMSLSGVCREWELAAQPVVKRGVRLVLMRSGVVITPRGGALARMIPPFKLGVGGRLGSGRQWMGWISLTDEVRAIRFLLDSTLSGPVNLVAPVPATNADLTRALAKALKRWAILPVPAFALRMIFGRMADETLLASHRVLPRRLSDAGFVFETPDIASALQQELRSTP